MTLREAQKLFDDSIQTKLSHKPNSITEETLIEIGQKGMVFKEIHSKVLYFKVGVTSSVVISSKMAYKEEQRQLSMIPGTKVIMTGAEGELLQYKDKVWNVAHGPQWMCGDNVVWLDGFSGSYCCSFLKIVE